jgi:hypothetical protein
MKTIIARAITALSAAALLSGCATSLGSTKIADVQRNAGHYSERTVTIDGTVTNSWGVPLVPFKLYKVNDGTGEMTVFSRGARTPSMGNHVRVRGVIRDVAVFGGQPLGLHLEEQSLDVKRN